MIGGIRAYIAAHWRGCFLVGGISVLLLSAGGALGSWLHPRVVTKTEIREVIKWQTQIQTVTVEKPVIKWRIRTVTETVYVPGTTEIKEVKVTKEDSGSRAEGSETHASAQSSGTTTATTTSSTSPLPAPRWSVRALVGASTSAGLVAGAGVDYRVLGPLTIGLWVTTALGQLSGQGGVSVGLDL